MSQHLLFHRENDPSSTSHSDSAPRQPAGTKVFSITLPRLWERVRHIVAEGHPEVPPVFPVPKLPAAQVDNITGLIARLAKETHHAADHIDLRDLRLDLDDLLAILNAASLLGFVDINQTDVHLTPIGRTFATADIQERKHIFRQQVMNHVWIVVMIDRLLQQEGGELPIHLALRQLETLDNTETARDQLSTAIEWGRYAEIYEYDDLTGRFRSPPPSS